MARVLDPYWFCGEILAPGNLELHPVYIQHLPKTGTTTLFTALKGAFDAQFQMIAEGVPNFTALRSGRLDAPEDLSVGRIREQFALIASHHPFGFHQRFEKPFTKLITVVREPYRRVYSAYTYGCMRSGEKPTPQGFKDFFGDETNRNVMSKLLSGRNVHDRSGDADAETSITNLHNNFVLFGTTAHITDITSQILKLNKLPNVLCDHLNKTEKEYLLPGDEFKDEILSLNDQDVSLFDHIHKNPRIEIPHLNEQRTNTPHQRTVLIQEVTNKTEGAFGRSLTVPTDRVLPLIVDGRCDKTQFDKFFESDT
ncbi:hypothetical protein [Magnetovibrio sp.]|uniref:hypothetical protein n=1 Tax=Magnetovibrio sp. TaxID=2024836 RepID=UPI002F9426C0